MLVNVDRQEEISEVTPSLQEACVCILKVSRPLRRLLFSASLRQQLSGDADVVQQRD